jgi:hypothetical protein
LLKRLRLRLLGVDNVSCEEAPKNLNELSFENFNGTCPRAGTQFRAA